MYIPRIARIELARSGRRVLPLALALFTSVPATAKESASRKKSCIDAHVASQELQKSDKLREARSRAAECSESDCPAPVQSACVALAQTIEAAIPTIEVQLREADGTGVSPDFLSLDGEAIAPDALDKPIEVDPGNRRLLARLGKREVEKSVLIVSGKKRQLITLDLPAPERPARRSEPAQPGARKVPVASIVLGGVGVLAIGSFAYFGLSGKSKQSDLEACKPRCDPALRDPIERDYRIADISLAVGVAALGVGTWLYLTSPRAEPSTGRVEWFVRTGAGTPQFAAGARF